MDQFKALKSIGGAARTANRTRLVFAGVLVAALAALAAMKLHSRPSAGAEEAADQPPTNPSSPSAIKLSPEKLRTARLHTAGCELRSLDDVRTVPGKIAYNESRRLEIKALVEGVLTKVLAEPGQAVAKGDPLAIVSSPEIGLARDEVAERRFELIRVQKEAARIEQIAANVAELLELLKSNPDPIVLEKAFDEKPLGDYRETIVGSYSRLYLAEAVAADTRTLEESGGVSGRLVEQRRSNREVAKAAFATACEQSKFAVSQARDKARAAVRHAERLFAVSTQRLEALGGDSSESKAAGETGLSEFAVRAPFDGVVEERLAVTTAHVAAGQPLFVLADTDTLWVSAEVPERDWNSLDDGVRQELTVRAPSLRGSETAARVKFVRGRISPETRTLTIVGELDNRDKKFRPGMFVWVSVPMSEPRRALAVPASAVVDHEQARFVFVVDAPDVFRRVDVTTGVETAEWIEITAGLEPGDQVVDQGTFALKSELLLEQATK